MTQANRRTFMMTVVAGGAALAAMQAQAQGAAVSETDPTAVSLGYKSDTTKVDGKKYPNHTNAQHCGVCQLYGGKAGDKAGPCPIFAGKQVSVNGWCSSFVKKAA